MNTALVLLFMPWAARRFSDSGQRGLTNAILSFSIFAGLSSLGYLAIIYFVGEPLTNLVYSGKYMEFARFLPVLALTPVISALTSGWLTGLKILEATSLVFLVDVLGAFLTLTLGIALLLNFGLAGVVVGTAISGASRILIIPWLWKKGTKDRSPHG
jgi:O-antigen/teichoic acid export membrane protein